MTVHTVTVKHVQYIQYGPYSYTRYSASTERTAGLDVRVVSRGWGVGVDLRPAQPVPGGHVDLGLSQRVPPLLGGRWRRAVQPQHDLATAG